MYQNANSRVFQKHATLALIPILASEALLRENKILQYQNVRVEPGTSDSKSNTLLSELTSHVILRESFCLSTTLFLGPDDLVRISRP